MSNANVARYCGRCIKGKQRFQIRYVLYYSFHIGDLLNDAVNGSEIIQLMQKVGNMSQNWRLVNYGKLFEKFASLYGIDYKTLQNESKYVTLDGEDRRKLSKAFRIEFTGKLDGRAGMGDVEELILSEELK